MTSEFMYNLQKVSYIFRCIRSSASIWIAFDSFINFVSAPRTKRLPGRRDFEVEILFLQLFLNPIWRLLYYIGSHYLVKSS